MPLILCEHCSIAVTLGQLPDNHKASCPRCGHVLTRAYPNIVDRMLIFSISALLCLAISTIFGFVEMSVQGQERQVSLLDTSSRLAQNNDWILAAISLLVLIVIPSIFAALLAYLSFSLKIGQAKNSTIRLLRAISFIGFWNMCEIYFLGILVSMVKIASLAHISFGIAFYSYAFFVLFLFAAYMHFDKYQLSQLIKKSISTQQNKVLPNDLA